jgi:Transglycosylase-like domain
MPVTLGPKAPARVSRDAKLRWIVSAALLGALATTPAMASAAAHESQGRASAEAPPRVSPEADFSDDDGTPYEEAIAVLSAEDIVTGCDDDGDRYCPRDPVRRDQAASLLVRAFDLPATRRDHFDDDDGNVHEPDINRLASAGISLGCTGAGYCADQTLRRNQMAALLVRADDVKKAGGRYFHDTAGDMHGGAVNRLAAAGITAGCSTTPARFCPNNDVLRGELAVFLARALDRLPRAELKPLPETKVSPKTSPPRAEPKAQRGSDTRKRRAPVHRPVRNTVWDRLAQCESGGNWSINTGNGYYGGLQFSLSSWRAAGGSGYPHKASRAEQIRRGERLKARQGWGAWPSCTSKLGLR